MKTINVRFDGMKPLLLHSNRTADPLDPYSKALKAATDSNGRNNKTDAGTLTVSRIEWEAGLYFDGEGYICIPGPNIEAMLAKAAKRSKDGPKVKRGVKVIEDFCRLRFDGENTKRKAAPKTQEDIPSAELDKAYEKYSDRRLAKLAGKTMLRTRPRFEKWYLECTIQFDEELINEGKLRQIIEVAAKYEGLGDYRERYGTFEATVVKSAKEVK